VFLSNNFLSLLISQFLLCPLLFAFCLFNNYAFLASTSVVGDIAVICGLLTVIIFGIYSQGDLETTFSKLSSQPFVLWISLPGFMGRAAFVFAVHMAGVPVMQNTAERNEFKRIAYLSYFAITFINLIFGSLGFILFLDDTCSEDTAQSSYAGPCSNILNNLHGAGLLHVVRVFLCIDLLFTIPVALGNQVNY
jgi:amino acid permease